MSKLAWVIDDESEWRDQNSEALENNNYDVRTFESVGAALLEYRKLKEEGQQDKIPATIVTDNQAIVEGLEPPAEFQGETTAAGHPLHHAHGTDLIEELQNDNIGLVLCSDDSALEQQVLEKTGLDALPPHIKAVGKQSEEMYARMGRSKVAEAAKETTQEAALAKAGIQQGSGGRGHG